jgi:DNA-binding NarL/FixJ family response regulator
VRALIIEDQAMFGDLLAKVCRSALSGAEVVVVNTITCARETLRPHAWQLLVVDIHLPDGDGIDFAQEARTRDPGLKIIGISGDCSEFMVSRVRESALHAFLDKSSQTVTDLWRALGEIAAGRQYLSPRVASVLHQLEASSDSFLKKLSKREILTLRMVGSGWSDPAIAEALEISRFTVKWHIKQLLRRLGIADRAQLIVYANQKGFANLRKGVRR